MTRKKGWVFSLVLAHKYKKTDKNKQNQVVEVVVTGRSSISRSKESSRISNGSTSSNAAWLL